ncbi:MAG: hypothetical protein P4L10_06700 [Acidobacteriaceae bacterium]|nr:hypothetical protein [Acidobacteriaceae bacterium]
MNRSSGVILSAAKDLSICLYPAASVRFVSLDVDTACQPALWIG